MRQQSLVRIGALALVVTLLLPGLAAAKESKHPRMPAPLAIDSHGDNNGLAKFKKHSENGKLKQLVGVVTAITGPVTDPKTDGSITVKKENGKLYTFNFDSTSTTKYTTFLRKYKATATWNEIMVGDAVHVFATKLTLSTATTFGRAIIVWDKGIWYAEAKGVVSNLNTATKAFTLTVTFKSIEYTTTVKYDDLTTYINSDGTAATVADLSNGDTIKVKGTWDAVGKFLLAKKIIFYPTI